MEIAAYETPNHINRTATVRTDNGGELTGRICDSFPGEIRINPTGTTFTITIRNSRIVTITLHP